MEYIQHGAFWITGFPAENPYRFLEAISKLVFSAEKTFLRWLLMAYRETIIGGL